MLDHESTSEQLLEIITGQASSYADLTAKTGLPREKLDAAIKGLRASRLIVVGLDGKFHKQGYYQPRVERRITYEVKSRIAHAMRDGAIKACGKRDREILSLRDQGLSHTAIGEKLGITKDSARKRFMRARKRSEYAQRRLNEIDEYGV